MTGKTMSELTSAEQTIAEQTIRQRIYRHGKITFAEFMQIALYHPIDGYYTSDRPFGADGDYYTSPAAHPAFGALLAVQLFGMWRGMGMPTDFTVVEMGAGNGMLANDICAYAGDLSADFADSLRYICIDRYAAADTWQSTGEGAIHIERVTADKLPLEGVVGCFISNELVDAFPVHRFEIVDGEPREIFVALDDSGDFVELLDTPSTPIIAQRLDALGFPLENGQRGEVNPHIKSWIGEIAAALGTGFVITIDYGYEAVELYAPERKYGTLQTYYRHTDGSSPYRRIGRQDLSAQVDFTLLQCEGHAAGLNTLAYTTQSEFLHALGIREMMRQLRSAPLSHHERSANLMAMRQLVQPDGLGRFRVLVQEKQSGVSSIEQILPDESARRGLLAPLLSFRHMPLMEGRYPQTSWEMPSLWDESQAYQLL
ncbi:MAG: class I SAM-dependent methyltransferase [Chloroflexi bacterium]|nr:class I SAM-dependent methyltransferase [Chloroflexota bacterium]